jgi:hypothetical protein
MIRFIQNHLILSAHYLFLLINAIGGLIYFFWCYFNNELRKNCSYGLVWGFGAIIGLMAPYLIVMLFPWEDWSLVSNPLITYLILILGWSETLLIMPIFIQLLSALISVRLYQRYKSKKFIPILIAITTGVLCIMSFAVTLSYR